MEGQRLVEDRYALEEPNDNEMEAHQCLGVVDERVQFGLRERAEEDGRHGDRHKGGKDVRDQHETDSQ